MAATLVSAHAPVQVIQPPSRWMPLDLGELWRHRELLGFLAWRDIKVRYKQTVLGVAWVVLQPLFLMGVFTLVFGAIAGLPSDGKPYAVFTLAALLPWQVFSAALNASSMSLITNAALVSKVYVPRLLLPLAPLVGAALDFLVGLALLLGLMALYGLVPPVQALAVPALLLLAMVVALSVGVWLAAVNVQYRDVRYALPFLTQVWLFATPVAYASSVIPEAYAPLFLLNPMVGVVDGFRWALLGSPLPAVPLAASAALGCALLAAGLVHFRRVESRFADAI